jgi:hypothetical protein
MTCRNRGVGGSEYAILPNASIHALFRCNTCHATCSGHSIVSSTTATPNDEANQLYAPGQVNSVHDDVGTIVVLFLINQEQ